NVIANIHPEFVILGPMRPDERDALEMSLARAPRIHLRTLDEVVAHFGEHDEHQLRLLEAPMENVAQLLWEGTEAKIIKADDLICLESREPLTDIAIVNLAFATGADLRWVEIPTSVTDLIQNEDEFLRTSSRARSVGQTIRQILEPYHLNLDL